MTTQPLISIVSPVYHAEQIVDSLVKEIMLYVSTITENFEIILVEDCGPDNSWEKILENCQKDKRIKGIKLSRNFGQHYAITAGLEYAKGEWVVVMDCDLQDLPNEIPNLYAKAQEGYDLVYAQRSTRHDSFFKRLSSKIFYSFFSYLTNTPQDSSIGNFGIYHQKVTKAILSMKDHIRFFPTMSNWVGFRQTKLSVKHSSRPEGESSYTLRTLMKLAFNNIIAFSDKPLWLVLRFGMYTSITAFLIGIYYLIKFLNGHIIIDGYTSIIISIWFLAGIIISILGMLGIYIGKIFEKVKDRPNYIVHIKENFDD
ncbi:MAG: glycosyltransferase family 2 protein [Saprospiraceae bacterium]|nr:glycosyltransferase family 2 protein [Saprospiraceae bacterium]